MTILWKWNETDTTEFGAPIFILGQLTGTLALERIAPFTSGTNIEPILRLNFADFHISGGLIGGAYSASAVVPINVGVDLPKRYTLCVNTWYTSASANARWGIVFGATSGAAGVYGHALYRRLRLQSEYPFMRALRGTNNLSAEITTLNNTGQTLHSITASVNVHKITIETSSLTGAVSGTSWRILSTSYADGQQTGANTFEGYNWNKERYITSFVEGDWTGAGNLTKLYFFIQNPITGSDPSKHYVDISNIYIEKHPLDE